MVSESVQCKGEISFYNINALQNIERNILFIHFFYYRKFLNCTVDDFQGKDEVDECVVLLFHHNLTVYIIQSF
jgi:hypothetical protein